MGDVTSPASATHSFDPTPEHSRDLRRAFGTFGTGVTVITTQTADGPLAMTANSFSSISLDPPLALWAPARDSQRHDAFTHADHFCIHVLSKAQCNMATHFAKNGTEFGAVDWQVGPFGAPTLAGCMAAFHCDRYAVHPAGDHSLVIGRIRRVTRADTNTPGLLFSAGKFGEFLPLDSDQ